MHENNNDIGWEKNYNNVGSDGNYDDTLIKNQISALNNKVSALNNKVSTLNNEVNKIDPLSPGVRMIAHRGYNVDIPENSIPAFEVAGLRGYWGVECDVAQTSDGHFVLMHDATIDRTTNGSGSVKELTLEEIKSCSIDTHAKFDGLKVPTLEEYIICCKRCNLVPIMEIKGDINIEKFYQVIKEYNIEDKCVVISFNNSTLESLRSLSSIIKIQTLSFKSFEHCIEYNFDIDIDITIVTADFIKDAHDMGLEVNVWTVNSGIDKYIDMGVDYITTDSLFIKTNVGIRLVAIEEDANCNNAVSNTLSYLGKDILTSNELCICKLYHGNRNWNKAIYYYPDDFYKAPYDSVRLISDIYSHRGYSTCSLMYDDSKYKVALYFFDMSDNHLIKESGWLSSSNIEYQLDDTDSYFALFIARVDGAKFTESDINELKSNLKVVFDKELAKEQLEALRGEPGKSISIEILTQEEYDALEVKDDYTFYAIKED